MVTSVAARPREGWLLTATPVMVLLFGYFSIPSLLFESDMASQLIARTSVMAIPPVLILHWHRIVTPPDVEVAA